MPQHSERLRGSDTIGSVDMTLEEAFCQRRDSSWYFVKPGGNWGDSLIYAGAESLADRLSLKRIDSDFRNFDPSALAPGSAIYLHGGGGFNPWGSGRAFDNLKKALSVHDAFVVQGPQTCETTSERTAQMFAAAFQGRKATHLVIFARENRSLKYLQENNPGWAQVALDSDTAFHLQAEDILALGGLNALPAGRYNLQVSREDDEAPPALMKREHSVVMDPAYFASSFAHWIRIHAFARRIVSNRLHSAIAGALLGRPVDLLAGSYHKNRSIWEYSLRSRGVRWVDNASDATASALPFQWVPKTLAGSWKVQRAVMWMRGVPLA
jgi:exopolysaccharide biosynthesis predicted pyruvyltransferase EpsI